MKLSHHTTPERQHKAISYNVAYIVFQVAACTVQSDGSFRESRVAFKQCLRCFQQLSGCTAQRC